MPRALSLILAVVGAVGAPHPPTPKAAPVASATEPAPVAKTAQAASPAQNAQKSSFPTDWMKPGNIMKYDLDADPMKNRIDSSADDVAQAHAFNLKHVDLLAKKKPAVEKVTSSKAAAKPSTPTTPDAANEWMKPGNIMKYDLDADPMKNRIDSSADDVEKARAFNLKHVDLVQKKVPAVVQATPAANSAAAKVSSPTPVAAVGKPAPATKAAQTASPAQDAQKPSFPTDWMKPGNIMKYDLDADPMKNRIDSSADDVAQAHAFNLKHVDLLAKKNPNVEKVTPTKDAAKASTPSAASAKSDSANDWMKPGNIMKYEIDADPMKNRIDSSADDVAQARAFNLKHVDLVQKKKPAVVQAMPAAVAGAAKVPTPVVAAAKSAPAFPTDWMKPGNIMKYDLDADPMKNRIDSSADDVAQAHAFNLKHVDLLAKKKPDVEKTTPTKDAAKASTPPTAAAKTDSANEWMKPGNIMKYDLDADPMKNRIDSSADDVAQARAFNLKHVDLLAKKAPVQKSAMELLYVDEE